MGRSLTGPGNIARSGDTMQGAFNEAKGNDIASSSVVNLVIATGNLVDITGGTTILSMILASGAERVLRFTGSLRLTHSANLVLPGGADIITLAGDFATVRGYPSGVVRVVVYTRASGYVQRIGDTMSGTLTLTGGTTNTPPMTYQAGSLTSLTVAHASEWNGTNLFQTNAAGVRKQIMYVDGDGSSITGLTQNQIITGLGYTPFNAGTTPSTISPPAGLMEIGRYLDFHSENSNNDYDARIDCMPPASGVGSSVINIQASQVQVTGSAVWTQASLTNLSQLTNGPGFAVDTNPTFFGSITLPTGASTATALRFSGSGANTGLIGTGTGSYAAVVAGNIAISYEAGGVTFKAGFRAGSINSGGELILEQSSGSTLAGNVAIGTGAQKFTISETGGNNRGAYIDLTTCANFAGTRLLTSLDLGTVSHSGTGYVINSNGLIMQWGKRQNGGIGSAYVSFPIAFPNACHLLLTSYDMTDNRGSYGSGGGASTTGANIYTDNCATYWFALGY